jgi:hypothetical protein
MRWFEVVVPTNNSIGVENLASSSDEGVSVAVTNVPLLPLDSNISLSLVFARR